MEDIYKKHVKNMIQKGFVYSEQYGYRANGPHGINKRNN